MKQIIDNKIYDTDRAEPLKGFRLECGNAYTEGTVYAEYDGSGRYRNYFIFHECMREGVIYHSIQPIAEDEETVTLEYVFGCGRSQKVTITLDDGR